MTARRPTQPPPRKRSAAKRPPRKGKGGRYSDEQRAEALRLLAEQGTAHAHKVTGVPKPTLSRWAKVAGIDTEATAKARTAAATEAVRTRAAEVRLTAVQTLEQHIDQAGHYLTTVVGVTAHAADLIADVDPTELRLEHGIAGPYVVVENTAAQDAQRRAMALASLPLNPRDAEGILTRAIHDLQLLKGEATERGELVVDFAGGIPRPTTVDVVDEDELGDETP